MSTLASVLGRLATPETASVTASHMMADVASLGPSVSPPPRLRAAGIQVLPVQAKKAAPCLLSRTVRCTLASTQGELCGPRFNPPS